MSNPGTETFEEIPFPELVRKSALAIAQGQTALDLNSIRTAQTLADMKLDAGSVVLSILEEVDEDGNVVDFQTVTNDTELSLLAYGVTPTFYEFSETEIDMRFWVRWYDHTREVDRTSTYEQSMRTSYEESEKKFGGGGGAALDLGFFKIGGRAGGSSTTTTGERETEIAVKRHSEYQSNVYGLDASASCRLKTRLVPKEAPDRAVPTVVQQPASE
ncbi:MAG: hypothetical protein V5A46_04635 [Haloferacaceae archaeon]